MTSREAPNLSFRKRLAFSAILFALAWLVVDTTAYVALRLLSSRVAIFYGLRPPTDDEIRTFVASGYDPALGWDLRKSVARGPLGEKQGHPYTSQARYKLKAFGDSFTEGVRTPTNSYEYAVEDLTGWTFLNFGVSGYGPDQGVLKYQRTAVSTEYVVLGILDENIGRTVNNLRGFYTLEESYRTKPRYARDRQGRIELLPNPINRAEDLVKLKDAAYVERLGRRDYWTQYFQALHAPRELLWPATRVVLPHLDFFVGQGFQLLRGVLRPSYEAVTGRTRFYHLYEPGSEGIAVLTHVVSEFAETARQRGETPLVLVFASRDTMDIMRSFGRKPYQTLVDYLEASQVPFIDYGDLFTNRSDLQTYFIPNDGHFNEIGNRHVAEAITAKIREMDGQAQGQRADER